jgi:hypothetical protein
MTRPRTRDRWRLHSIVDAVVTIHHAQRDRRTNRAPLSQSTEKFGEIGFDLLSRTTAVSTLSSRELSIDTCRIDLDVAWHSVDDRDKRGAMRFTGGLVAKWSGHAISR